MHIPKYRFAEAEVRAAWEVECAAAETAWAAECARVGAVNATRLEEAKRRFEENEANTELLRLAAIEEAKREAAAKKKHGEAVEVSRELHRWRAGRREITHRQDVVSARLQHAKDELTRQVAYAAEAARRAEEHAAAAAAWDAERAAKTAHAEARRRCRWNTSGFGYIGYVWVCWRSLRPK